MTSPLSGSNNSSSGSNGDGSGAGSAGGTGNVKPTAGVVANGSVGSTLINSATVTAQSSTSSSDQHGIPAAAVALPICLLLVGVAVMCIFIYLKKTGRLYGMIPFKKLGAKGRSSNTSSHNRLDAEEMEPANPAGSQLDDLPNRRDREGNMFTIDDFDMESLDMDRASRGTNDEYYYDEVFGKSMFEDEATNASMRQLYLASERDDDDMFDVEAIVSSIVSSDKPNNTAPASTASSRKI